MKLKISSPSPAGSTATSTLLQQELIVMPSENSAALYLSAEDVQKTPFLACALRYLFTPSLHVIGFLVSILECPALGLDNP